MRYDPVMWNIKINKIMLGVLGGNNRLRFFDKARTT
jgi:hypothetical protein